MSEIRYRAFGYARLSKEDFRVRTSRNNSQFIIGDESNSIKNQQRLITNYADADAEIELVRFFIDDGHTGLDYDRNGFREMMELIPKENINCVIIKDFSRLGREFLNNCRYIERIFPQMGVRLIAINEGYDGAKERTQADNIVIPVKNLFNDQFSKDNSIRVKSNLKVKRAAGEFTAPFAVYGYRRSVSDKGTLEIDLAAASVIQDIFVMKLQGYSNQHIAEKLNERGVLPPLEYKRATGSAYTTSFKKKDYFEWSGNMIMRILCNRVYVGDLEQGKIEKVNYKSKKRRIVPREEWIIQEKKHPAIIRDDIFEIVQRLSAQDSRIAPGRETVYLFSGLLKCADCNEYMQRKAERHGNKQYVYYICGTYKRGRGCSSHRIREDVVYKTICSVIFTHVKTLVDLEKVQNNIEMRSKFKAERIVFMNKEIEEYRRKLDGGIRKINSLQEDYKKEILDYQEYTELKELYCKELSLLKKILNEKECQIRKCYSNTEEGIHWLDRLVNYGHELKLDRMMLVLLVHHIDVIDKNHIRIVLNYQDEFEAYVSWLKKGDKRYG